ncbi:MAPK7 [Acanthosepion pharaonis]|uniref:MAPK7 n=1 Tax=Acanthosepion pharaonis TaxID=158019 RepID=A0A812DY73_ACAPH|nr:MAPK7 [Sepia pharaonis]
MLSETILTILQSNISCFLKQSKMAENKPSSNFQDIYVVLDLMESDLHQIIYSKQPLTEEHIRYFLYQILRGLKYIHSANVIHRDLKPKNLLVRENCHLRIGDFGMARGISSSQSDNENCFLTLYVATRWYRAPEIMFSLLDYSSAMDMWSVGCIFAEMLGRKHLFPGKYYIEQAQLIIDVLGSPSEKFLSACKSDIIKTFIKQMEKKNPVPWSTLYPKASRRALDLLGKMLVLNPSDRVTVEQALRHPYFTGYHDQDDEPICVPAFNFDFEKQDTTVAQFREAIYDEIIEFHEQKNPVLNFNPVLRPAPKTNENVKNSLGDSSSLRPSSLSSSLEITEQGAALQAYVKQLRERFKSSSTADKIKHSLQAGGKENQQLSITCHYLSKESVSDSTSNSTSGKSSISCKSLLSVSTLSDDVEMLSAKSTELKMDSTSSLPKTPASQTQDSQGSGSDNQTISADTKELIKAALRNATLKKRGENEVKDDGRPRPVTAAQRQREREDKRRKRRERALKRMKDKKDADTEEQLSDADKELLERWKNMQTQKSTSQLIKNVTNSNNTTPSSSLTLCPEQEPLPVLLGSTQQQAPCNGSISSALFVQTDIPLSTASVEDGFPNVMKWKNLSFERSSSNENSISSNNVFEIIDKNQKQIYTMSSEASSLTSSSVGTAGNLMSNSPETNFPNGSFQNQFSPLPTIQVSCIEEDKKNVLQEKSLVTQQGEGSSDLISALSKQLSKYQVEDSVPPALALTPKGTGNGYGVGLDLDAFMAENLSDKNDCNKFLSPLSSSLLANWMDVTANMDIQGLEKELELSMLSPMALSYTDLRLYSS